MLRRKPLAYGLPVAGLKVMSGTGGALVSGAEMGRATMRAATSLLRWLPSFLGMWALLSSSAWAQATDVTFHGPQGVELHGVQYRPGGAGPFPAVVALHGCGGLYDRSGVLNARHADWGERLAAQGFLVLFPDSFGSRGLGSQCSTIGRAIRPGRERAADAEAAKAYLQARPDVRPTAVSLLGWSNGGSTVLYAAGARVADGRPPFARAVAFYPGCRALAERGWHDRVPLQILVGGADDWTGAAACQNLAAAAQARGEPVAITVYPGAYHDFDHPALPIRERRGLAHTVAGDGVAHVGTDPAAREDALIRVPAFLAR
ncbi:dienelactone hydrolase [Methylobacterium sp. OAE515]|jgi:dienelactone hydrolase|uniref:dienelactone hydrolase family protein n=1 Tax=Methylobacterium sp. OAE515 TaxID=2817895 RepID=UPI0019FC2441